MSGNRQKEIVRHLSEDVFDRFLTETDDEKLSKRLTFVKDLYIGDMERNLGGVEQRIGIEDECDKELAPSEF